MTLVASNVVASESAALGFLASTAGVLESQAVSAGVAAEILSSHVNNQQEFRDLLGGMRIVDSSRSLDTEKVQHVLATTLERSHALLAERRSVHWEAKQCGSDGHIYDQHTQDIPDFARLVMIGAVNVTGTDPSNALVLDEATIFRQYTTMAGLVAILGSQVLIPGPLFFSYNGGAHYLKLVGAFLTVPEFSPQEVGVPNNPFYVDLQLLSGTAMLALNNHRSEFGRYFMIPGVPMLQGWLLRSYATWVAAGCPSKEECNRISGEAWQRKVPYMFEYKHPEYIKNSAEYSAWVAIESSYEKLCEMLQQGVQLPTEIPMGVVGAGVV